MNFNTFRRLERLRTVFKTDKILFFVLAIVAIFLFLKLWDFLNSDLGILLIGSLILPFILKSWEDYKIQAERDNEKHMLTRLAIWRYKLVIDGCQLEQNSDGDYKFKDDIKLDGFEHALDALRCGKSYQQLNPYLEKSRPLAGLVMELLRQQNCNDDEEGDLMTLEAKIQDVVNHYQDCFSKDSKCENKKKELIESWKIIRGYQKKWIEKLKKGNDNDILSTSLTSPNPDRT